jgi:hypothetical protein
MKVINDESTEITFFKMIFFSRKKAKLHKKGTK